MPWTQVYIDKNAAVMLREDGLRAVSYRSALCEAQRQILETMPEAFILGEGVDDAGGIFGTTLGLVDIFGKDRVMDCPIAENGMTGIAVGAAAAGMKPIFVHQRIDFLPMCFDQIANHAAKLHYMTGGRVHVPLVIRSIIGRGFGSSAQHSQALQSIFMHIPGLTVVMPSTPYDAKGLLIAALEDGNPVLFIEHRWVYDYVGYVPEEMFRVPVGQGIVRREGTDVTVVALSQMVYEAMKAAKALEQKGVSIELIDPRSVKPLDVKLILESVQKTGRLVVADVACKTGGVGAEICCRIAEHDPGCLKAPVKRISFPDVPTPCSPVLEAAYYPDENTIAETVLACLEEA